MKEHPSNRIGVSNLARRFTPGIRQIQLFAIVLLGSGLLFSCAQIRKATYPDDYVYLEQKQVTSKMALLSFYLRKIDEILLEDSTINSEQQERIADILVSMSDIIDTLDQAGEAQTSHLVIDDHLDQFRSDLNLALYNVRADPPNYFALGKLSGSCAACHQYRNF
jgi:hypothetical protein